jgi:hypothetical protein
VNDLELMLREVAAEIDWPPTPGVTPLQLGAPRRRRLRIGRPLAIAFAALLLLAAGAVAVLRGENKAKRPAVHHAQRGFSPLHATGLGKARVSREGFPPGGKVILRYPGGVVITELQGRFVPQYLFKFLRPNVRVDRLRIDGGAARWIQGEVRQYVYADRTGAIHPDTVPSGADVLLWNRGPLLVRIEGARTKAAALAIARGLHAGP